MMTAHDTTFRKNEALLRAVATAVEAAGKRLRSRVDAAFPPTDLDGIQAAITANDRASLEDLRDALERLSPDVGWIENELDAGPLPSGEWWIVDAAEGNINHVQSLPGWGVTATLVRDGSPVLAAFTMPLESITFTATRGGGAFANSTRLHVSSKTELRAAIVATGQAMPGEDAATHRRLASSVGIMLEKALLVSVSVPATLQLAYLASGRIDAFWQFSAVRSGLAAGALLVAEAGGIVTDVHGEPWTFGSSAFVASAPGIHAALVDSLVGAAA